MSVHTFNAAYEYDWPTSTVYRKTTANTVVIGQKVHAKLVVDEACFSVATKQWSSAWPNDAVKGYETDDSHGAVIYHDINDYSSSEFVCYYTNTSTPLRTGSVACYVEMSYIVDGYTRYCAPSLGASYYIVAPTGVSLAASQTGTRLLNGSGPNDTMQLSSTSRDGMVFEAGITAPVINGAGTVFFLQTVNTQRDRSDPGNPNDPENPDQEMSSGNAVVLDGAIPYGSDFTPPIPHLWTIDAGETLSSSQYKDEPLKTIDSPGVDLELDPVVFIPTEEIEEGVWEGDEEPRHYTTYKANDSFVMYLTYLPLYCRSVRNTSFSY